MTDTLNFSPDDLELPISRGAAMAHGCCLPSSPVAALRIPLLSRLRQRFGISQVELAIRLKVSQPYIAQLEKQDDMRLSTLKRHIEALGGELELVARFPTSTYRIDPERDALTDLRA